MSRNCNTPCVLRRCVDSCRAHSPTKLLRGGRNGSHLQQSNSFFGTDYTDITVGAGFKPAPTRINFPAPSGETGHISNIRVICVFRFAEPVPKNRNEWVVKMILKCKLFHAPSNKSEDLVECLQIQYDSGDYPLTKSINTRKFFTYNA